MRAVSLSDTLVPMKHLPPILVSLLLAAPAGASELSGINASEYYQASYYRDAQEHPKIAKLKDRMAKIKAIAGDLKIKPKALEQAIQKVDALGGDPSEIVKLAEKAVRSAAEKTRMKGKLLDVLVNTDEPKHVVLYVRWQSTSSR